MARLLRVVCSLLAFLGIAGCEPSATDPSRPRPEDVPIKVLIESYADAPRSESIAEVSRGLARCKIMLATEEVPEEGEPLRLRTSFDNEGTVWVYAYTDESELLAAFPDGSAYAKLEFADAFKVIKRNPQYGGMVINFTEKYRYLIPRDEFGTVEDQLKAVSRSSSN